MTERVRRPTPACCSARCRWSASWQAEARKFATDLRVYAHHGPQRLRGQDLTDQLARTDIVVTTYGTATRDLDELAEIDWNRVVLDEPRPSRTATREPPRPWAGCAGSIGWRSPAPRWRTGLGELWSIMNFLNLGCSARPRSSRPGTRSRSSGTPILPPRPGCGR